ncbi:CAAX protease self-immunity-domain-containing protein, partial [Ochromonadaceae sp. CCMP2298]
LRAVVVAPITEEVVFRAVMVPALQDMGMGSQEPWRVVWLTPLCFGLAHLHHLREKLVSGWSLPQALVSTLVQFTYTSIFGLIATLLFMRAGLYSAVLSHVICNAVGLPDVGFLRVYSCLYGWRHVHVCVHLLGL